MSRPRMDSYSFVGRTICLNCSAAMVTVTIEWRELADGLRPVIVDYRCPNGCSLDEPAPSPNDR